MWCVLAYLTIRYLTSGFRADWQFTIAFYNPDMRTPYRLAWPSSPPSPTRDDTASFFPYVLLKADAKPHPKFCTTSKLHDESRSIAGL